MPIFSYAQHPAAIKHDTLTKMCRSDTPSNLSSIVNVLFYNDMLLTDYWKNNNTGYNPKSDVKLFNSYFKTSVFSKIFEINFVCVYPSTYDCSEYIKIKEWCFSTREEAAAAIRMLQNIHQIDIIAIKPIIWLFIPTETNIYFIESNSFDLKNIYIKKIKNTIMQLSPKNTFPAVEFSR